jgi:hypothetical protein
VVVVDRVEDSPFCKLTGAGWMLACNSSSFSRHGFIRSHMSCALARIAVPCDSGLLLGLAWLSVAVHVGTWQRCYGMLLPANPAKVLGAFWEVLHQQLMTASRWFLDLRGGVQLLVTQKTTDHVASEPDSCGPHPLLGPRAASGPHLECAP